uniref:Acetyl-coenzyme A carboxylase carboxyl transferase subunit beta, chloroplastic n=2 Tax=Vanilla planifolia TaxID=51239 RepID=A0A0D3M9M9_VANPL|nr:acetyl-CoA carboxylase carboxyl transferase subunit beta [Vanilla planifolia]AID52153.1 acetyl-CoA carboxylase carboxyl transferase subunit beta [Vanilla planifolia]
MCVRLVSQFPFCGFFMISFCNSIFLIQNFQIKRKRRLKRMCELRLSSNRFDTTGYTSSSNGEDLRNIDLNGSEIYEKKKKIKRGNGSPNLDRKTKSLDKKNIKVSVDTDNENIIKVSTDTDKENIKKVSADTNNENIKKVSADTNKGNRKIWERRKISDSKNIKISDSENMKISDSENMKISDSENMKISDSENIKKQNIKKENIKVRDGTDKGNKKRWERRKIVDSENIKISDSENIKISDSENIKISDSENIKISDSENIKKENTKVRDDTDKGNRKRWDKEEKKISDKEKRKRWSKGKIKISDQEKIKGWDKEKRKESKDPYEDELYEFEFDPWYDERKLDLYFDESELGTWSSDDDDSIYIESNEYDQSNYFDSWNDSNSYSDPSNYFDSPNDLNSYSDPYSDQSNYFDSSNDLNSYSDPSNSCSDPSNSCSDQSESDDPDRSDDSDQSESDKSDRSDDSDRSDKSDQSKSDKSDRITTMSLEELEDELRDRFLYTFPEFERIIEQYIDDKNFKNLEESLEIAGDEYFNKLEDKSYLKKIVKEYLKKLDEECLQRLDGESTNQLDQESFKDLEKEYFKKLAKHFKKSDDSDESESVDLEELLNRLLESCGSDQSEPCDSDRSDKSDQSQSDDSDQSKSDDSHQSKSDKSDQSKSVDLVDLFDRILEFLYSDQSESDDSDQSKSDKSDQSQSDDSNYDYDSYSPNSLDELNDSNSYSDPSNSCSGQSEPCDSDRSDDSDQSESDKSDQSESNDSDSSNKSDSSDRFDTSKFKQFWVLCENCWLVNLKRFLKRRMYICEHCGSHLKMGSSDRIQLLLDPDTWEPIYEDLVAIDIDPIEFHSEDDPYIDRIHLCQEQTNLTEAIQIGIGRLNNIPIAIGVMEYEFIAGSMGSVVGEKITRLIEYATNRSLPVIIVCASGGARMQEGSLSLLQMAKISSASYEYQLNKKLFYISILTSPTTGGVTASFGMLGDIIIAEPNAYIAFAGKRVIEETLKKPVPEGVQETEYLFIKGSFDLIVPRQLLKGVLSELLRLHGYIPIHGYLPPPLN